jgi:hypothetical protein
MKRPSPSPLGNNPSPSTTADARWEFVRTAVEAADVDPIDVALAALDMTAAVPDESLFRAGLIELLTSARAAAALRRGEKPCDCEVCLAKSATAPAGEITYGNDGVVRYAGVPVVMVPSGDES